MGRGRERERGKEKARDLMPTPRSVAVCGPFYLHVCVSDTCLAGSFHMSSFFLTRRGWGGGKLGPREGKGPGVVRAPPLLVSSVLASAFCPPAGPLGQEGLRKHPWKPRPATRVGRRTPALTDGAQTSVGSHPPGPLDIQHWRDQESSGKCPLDKCREERPGGGWVGPGGPREPAWPSRCGAWTLCPLHSFLELTFAL